MTETNEKYGEMHHRRNSGSERLWRGNLRATEASKSNETENKSILMAPAWHSMFTSRRLYPRINTHKRKQVDQKKSVISGEALPWKKLLCWPCICRLCVVLSAFIALLLPQTIYIALTDLALTLIVCLRCEEILSIILNLDRLARSAQ
jgi:hypothetical protein